MTRSSLLVLLCAASVGCRPDCTPRPGPVRPSVVLVTIDTLRADHLGCYGNATVRTPNIDRLAREGALFERCYAQAPITVPSHLSILSSLPLAEHGLLHNGGSPARRVDVLPEIFARAGYRTAAFVGAKHLGPEGTLAPLLTSLEVYSAPRRVSAPFTAHDTNKRLFRWLRGACRDPFFAWVHYWEPHMPYVPPAPFDRTYYDGDPYDARHTSMSGVALGWFLYDLDGVRQRLAERARQVRSLKRDLGLRSAAVRQLVLYRQGLKTYAPTEEAEATLRGRLAGLGAHLRSRLPFRRHLADWLTGVRDLRFAVAQYAGEVSYVDEELGRLIDGLVRLGLQERTIVVVTADHGESLGEHGIYFDHAGLHETSLRVPLVVWAPGRVPPGRRGGVARGLDVAPTVLRLAGLGVPSEMQGRDVLAAGERSGPVISEAARGVQIMVMDGPWKLIRTLQGFYYVDAFAREAGTEELYDLGTDPGEGQNVLGQEAEVARRLRAGLDTWIAAHGAGAENPTASAPLAPERVRELRALGYVE
jgi:arylsulfatase